MKISILMPVRNAMPYLRECLDSILAQTTEDWELLAVNDHSTDDSKAVLQAFSEKDNRIQVFDNQGKGIIHALRLAYAHSMGVYLTRMDADDIMPPEKLTTLRDLLLTNGRGHIATGMVRYFAKDGVKDGYQKYENWLNDLTRRRANFEDIYKECVIASPCWMLHREDLEACGAFRADRYPEDYDLCFRMYEAGLKVVGSDDVLHFWRDHSSRASRNDDNYADNRFLDLKLYCFLKLERKINPSSDTFKVSDEFSELDSYSSDILEMSDETLVIWGAGKKGKMIAQYLLEKEVDFHWVCENERKIGVDIYGKKLHSPDLIPNLNEPQIIIAVAGENAQKEIITQLSGFKLSKGKDWFLFC